MDTDEQPKLTTRLRRGFLGRYNSAFTMAVLVGSFLTPYALSVSDAMIGFPVGVSLIISGGVGLAMSFMTSKVAEELKSIIREGDQKNYEMLESIDSTLKELVEVLKNK